MYEVRPYPQPLSDKIQQAVFAFERNAFPGLAVASHVHGDQTEAFFATSLADRMTAQDIEAYMPDPYLLQRPHPAITSNVADKVTALWRRQYAGEADAAVSASTKPNIGEDGQAICSPFTEHEQILMGGYVQDFIHKNIKYRDVLQIYRRPELIERVFPHLSALILSVVSDVSAMPRVMAGMDFEREKSNILRMFADDIGDQGVVDDTYLSPQSLLYDIPWVLPSLDPTPVVTRRATVALREGRVLVSQMLKIFTTLTVIDPRRFLVPLDEIPVSSFRSPYRVNSRHALDTLLGHCDTDQAMRGAINTFLRGERIELPPGVSSTYIRLPKAAERPPIYDPATSRAWSEIALPETIPAEASETVSEKEMRQNLTEAHVAAMKNLHENELGQELIALVQNNCGVVEVANGERLDHKQLPLTLVGRLRNIARIFSTMQPNSEAFPPQITPPKDSKELINDITGGFAGRLQSLHLCIEPEKASTVRHKRGSESDPALRVGVVVGKRSTGYKRSEFSGAYFKIRIKPPLGSGIRPVTIDREGDMPAVKIRELVTDFIAPNDTSKGSA